MTRRKRKKTQRKQREETLRRAQAAAETANVAKNQFLANMSHELRTPMNAILGMTDLALSEQLPAMVRDYLQTTKEAANRLLELLNEILDFSHIEAGGFELESTPFSLSKTVQQVVTTIGSRAYEKGLKLACELPNDLPDNVVGDPLRLRQVLISLVKNAVKFTPNGKIILQVAIERQSPQAVVLRFSVSDTGIGIASENLEKIFTPFAQADPSTTRRFGGTGLGLAVSQRLVNLMGGRIRVESQPCKGSTFQFAVTLPLGERGQAASGATSTVLRAPIRQLRVLVAEDTLANQIVVLHLLGRRGHCVKVAQNGLQALELLQNHDFDVILMDVQMPEMDGLAATAAIRKFDEPTKSRLPVIAITANTLTGDREHCLAAGMDGYISKPIKGEELIEMVERLAEKSAAASEPHF